MFAGLLVKTICMERRWLIVSDCSVAHIWEEIPHCHPNNIYVCIILYSSLHLGYCILLLNKLTLHLTYSESTTHGITLSCSYGGDQVKRS